MSRSGKEEQELAEADKDDGHAGKPYGDTYLVSYTCTPPAPLLVYYGIKANNC